MKYFDLSEDDSWKIHMLFSPRVVPIWLTKKQITFCLDLYDKIHPKGHESEGGAKLIELYCALKSDVLRDTENTDLHSVLYSVFSQKMSIKKQCNNLERIIVAFEEYIKDFPKYKQDEYRIRFFNGDLDDFSWWQKLP